MSYNIQHLVANTIHVDGVDLDLMIEAFARIRDGWPIAK